MSNTDIRWEQRLSNYSKALNHLTMAINLSTERTLSDLEKQGLIQGFEFTHELAWNVMKDYFFFQGNSSITGSRDATREAFSCGLIAHGDVWMEMIKSRNQTSHTYQQAIANEIAERIIRDYYPCFQAFLNTMQKRKAHDK